MDSTKKSLNIGVFGGSQGVGKHCISQALLLGHNITVLARDVTKLSDLEGNPKLRIIQGDALNPEKVAQVVENQNLIINSLGGMDNIASQGTKVIINAMKEKNVKRIITCTSLGVGDSYKDCSFMTKTFIWGFISKPIADKNVQEKYLFESGLDSIIVRPARLTNEPAKGVLRTQGVSAGSVPRADVAAFMLKQLESDEYLGKAVSLASE